MNSISIPKNAKEIFGILGKVHNFEVYLVGGCVRDMLLGREPHDFDFATNATPVEVARAFKGIIHWDVVPTGLEHGTLTVVYKNTQGAPFETYEITTYRTDNNCDGRHADVVFSLTPEEDAKRRDFTVNALYMDAHGNVSDMGLGGLRDLDDKILRFVGNPHNRIAEDYLRILRFGRLRAQLGFNGDTNSGVACVEMAEGLVGVSKERIREEILKMLATDNWFSAAAWLGFIDDKETTGIHMTEVMEPLTTVEARLYHMTYLGVSRLKEKLCLSNEMTSDLQFLEDVSLGGLTAGALAWKFYLSPKKRHLFYDAAVLSGVDTVTARQLSESPVTQLVLSGEQVMTRADLKPGPEVGRLLRIAHRIHFETKGFLTPGQILDIVCS